MINEIVKDPIYKQYSFTIIGDKISNNTELFLSIFNIKESKHRIYCPYCEHIETFKHDSVIGASNYSSKRGKRYFITKTDCFEFDGSNIYVDLISEGTARMVRNQEYFCSMDVSHKIKMYFTLSKTYTEIVITKIGQTPSPYDLGVKTTLEYKSVLDKFKAYPDYKQSFIHKVYGDGIAELLYIRRVFEKMINYLLNDKTLETDLVDKKLKHLRSMSKLDPDTEELSGMVYGLLSKGIHQLTDKECQELSGSLRYFIELQLIFLEQQRERKHKVDLLKSSIRINHEKHNNKDS